MDIEVNKEYSIKPVDYGEVFESKRAHLSWAVDQLVASGADLPEAMGDRNVLVIDVMAANGTEGDPEQWVVVDRGAELYKIVPDPDDSLEPRVFPLTHGTTVEDCNDLGRVTQAVIACIPRDRRLGLLSL